jgi:hypothetical protein
MMRRKKTTRRTEGRKIKGTSLQSRNSWRGPGRKRLWPRSSSSKVDSQTREKRKETNSRTS